MGLGWMSKWCTCWMLDIEYDSKWFCSICMLDLCGMHKRWMEKEFGWKYCLLFGLGKPIWTMKHFAQAKCSHSAVVKFTSCSRWRVVQVIRSCQGLHLHHTCCRILRHLLSVLAEVQGMLKWRTRWNGDRARLKTNMNMIPSHEKWVAKSYESAIASVQLQFSDLPVKAIYRNSASVSNCAAAFTLFLKCLHGAKQAVAACMHEFSGVLSRYDSATQLSVPERSLAMLQSWAIASIVFGGVRSIRSPSISSNSGWRSWMKHKFHFAIPVWFCRVKRTWVILFLKGMRTNETKWESWGCAWHAWLITTTICMHAIIASPRSREVWRMWHTACTGSTCM